MMDLFGNSTGGNNPAESQFYSQLFQTFDTQRIGTVQGGQVFGFFLSSGLNKAALGDIWDEATQKQSGGLNLPKFMNAMRLISLAQKGIAPKLQNIAANSPIPIAQMQFPSHLQVPNISQSAQPSQMMSSGVTQQPQQPQQQQQQAQKPAEPDPFGALTSSLGFDLGSSNNGNNNASSKPAGPTWDTDLTGTGATTNSGNDLLGAGSGGGTMDVNNYDTNTVISHNSTFDSPKFNANSNPNGTNDNMSLTPGGPITNGNTTNTSMINEYAPTSHMKQMSHAPTLVVDHHAGVGGASMGLSTGITTGYGASDDVAPPGLNRRISTKILYQEERLREQIRQAEQREKLAKKQANTQRIENERLERENEQLKLEINQARQAQADALKQSQEAITSVQPLRVENEKLKQAINQWKELIQTKDEELEQLEQEVDSLRLENEKLENNLTADKSKVDDFQFKLERSEALLQELKKKNRNYEMEINELKQEKISLEDDKRNLDLQIVQIKDEMKKLKRNQNSGLGISDRNTLKQKEASLFDINNIGLGISPSPSKPTSTTSTNINSLNNGITDVMMSGADDDKPESDDDDTGIVPPGSHDFNFDISADNNGANEYGPGAALNKPNNNNNINTDDIDDYDDNEPDMIDKIIDEKVEIEEDVVKTILIDDEYKSSEWYMSSSDIKTYHKYFLQADTNQDGLIDGGEANKFFTKSKLNRKLLAKIWVLADQNKKGKLTEPMFCSMFHLVMKIKKSGGKLQVPSELPECLTIGIVEKLGTTIQKTVKQKKWITQKKTIKVANPNKKNKKSKKPKKKKTPPPNNDNKKTDPLSFGDDWGADFGNTDWGSSNNNQTQTNTTTTTTTDTMNNGSFQQENKPPTTQNDDNWNAFGNFLYGDQ